MIKSLVVLAMSTTINSSGHSTTDQTIVNFGDVGTPAFFQDFIDQIPYSDHLTVNTPETGVKISYKFQ